MPYYDNPAGRLHNLLLKLNEQEPSWSLQQCWARVLDVEVDAVVIQLGRVAELVRETHDAVERLGEDVFVKTVQRYRSDWTRPIFPTQHAFSAALSNVLPEEAALDALGMVSVHLHSTASDGVMPAQDRIDKLDTQVRELIEAVGEDEDIPVELKHLITQRLQDVADALNHLDIGGPNAVRHATEAVIGCVALSAGNKRFVNSQTVRTLWSVLGVAWTLFSVPPTAEHSLESWEKIIPQLPAPLAKSAKDPSAEKQQPAATGDGGTDAPVSAD